MMMMLLMMMMMMIVLVLVVLVLLVTKTVLHESVGAEIPQSPTGLAKR